MLNLRPFQEEDVNFLQKLNRAACFNEQRTGKTPIILTVLKNRKIDRVFILCPKSAVPIWKTEIKKWYPDPGYITVIGSRAQKEVIISKWNNELLIMSIDSFKKTQTALGFIEEILRHKPRAMVLDEAHRIQNQKTAVAKAVFKTVVIKIRYALTGTPAISKSYRVWSILHWLYPEYFKGYWTFIKTYFHTFTIKNQKGDEIIKEGYIRKNKQDDLWNILKQFCTQRKRKDVMPWLPDKEYIPVMLEPTNLQLKYLQELEDYFETEDLIVENTLSRLVRYRQICLDPGILNLTGTSPKTDWILDYLEDYPEEKIIIFSKFTEYLNRLYPKIKKIYPETALFTGKTSEKEREEISDRFQNSSLQYILANIDAAREAVTWDAASTEIFTDKYPPIGYIEQAEDRFVATTPAKAVLPHKIYELQLEGTYDEIIYQMLGKAKSETDLINNFKNKMRQKK